MTRDLAAVIGLLADATAKATLLLLLAWVLASAMRRGSAALRHRLWALALGGSIAMPVASWLVPAWRLPVLPGPSPASPAMASRPAAPVPVVLGPPMISAIPDRPAVPPPGVDITLESTPLPRRVPAPAWPIAGIGLAAWGAGAIAAVLPTLLGLLGNVRLRRRSRPVVDEDWLDLSETLRRAWSIRRPVALLLGDDATIPLTWGVIRPAILLPGDAPSWPFGKRRAVLLHELAHIRRSDAGLLLLGRLAAAIYWFHPLAWYAMHRLRVECEHASDDCVVQAGERPTDYAGRLLELAQSARRPRFAMNIAMARPNALEDRLRALFDETRSHRALDRRSGRWLAAGATALVLGLAMVRPGASDARPGEPPDPPAVMASPPNLAEPPAKGTGRIVGRVVRGAGEPAAGAEVILLSPPPGSRGASIGRLPLRRAGADAAGAFAFDALLPGRYRVWANLGKLTSRSERSRGEWVIVPESGAAPGAVELRLVPGVGVTVTVRDKATGRPIPGATVQPQWGDFLDDFTTDRDGRALARPFTRERWRLDVWADGFARQSRWINLESGSDAEAEFGLEPGGDLEGVVRDPEGRPAPGVGVSVFPEEQFEQSAYVETDAAGRYRLRSLPLNIGLRVQIFKDPGYDRDTITTRLTGARRELDLRLKRRPHGGSIAGVVRDRQGRPIAGAELHNPSNASSVFREVKTGPDGRFRMDDLYESFTGKEVLVRARGFAPRWVKVEPGPADRPAEVAIEMEPGHRLRGRVVDDRGRPIEGVRVYFAASNHAHQGGGRTTTDAQGGFEFDSLPDRCPFAFAKEGYSDIDNRQLPLDTGEVVTVAMAPSGVVLGRVVDGRTGRPIRSFRVQLTHSPRRQPGDPAAGLRLDLSSPGQDFQSGEGLFRVGDLVVDMPLRVMVSADGHERAVIERVVAARPDEARAEEFRLDPIDPATLRTYRVRLRDASGKPVAGAQLRLIAARDRDPARRVDFPFNWPMIRNGQLAQQPNVVRFVVAATDARGRFEFAGIPEVAEVELAWWGRGVTPGRADHLEAEAGDREGWFDITLDPPARIVGVIDRRAYPTAARIELNGPIATNDMALIDLKPDQAEFAFEDLAPGKYSVRLTSAFGRDPARIGALLPAQDLGTVNLTVRSGEAARADFKP